MGARDGGKALNRGHGMGAIEWSIECLWMWFVREMFPEKSEIMGRVALFNCDSVLNNSVMVRRKPHISEADSILRQDSITESCLFAIYLLSKAA